MLSGFYICRTPQNGSLGSPARLAMVVALQAQQVALEGKDSFLLWSVVLRLLHVL